MMNGIDRLVAAINGKPADRVPVFCNLLDQGAKEMGIPLETYYAHGDCVAEAQIKMRARFGYDNVWSLFYVGKEAEFFGCRDIIFATDGPPNVGTFIVKNENDIHNLQVPDDISNHPVFAESLKCLRILRHELGGKQPICAYITASMALPALLMGMDRWLELLFMGDWRLCEELLQKCHLFFIREMQAYREAGVDVLVYSNPFGSTDTVPMKFFLSHSLPWIEKDIQAVGIQGVVFYCGMSRLNPTIPMVLERTGIGVYYLSPFDDIRAGKAQIAGRGLTCGVINDIKLVDWSTEQVRSEVRFMMEAGKAGGKYLFGTGVMPYGIPENNIKEMVESAIEYGRYDHAD